VRCAGGVEGTPTIVSATTIAPICISYFLLTMSALDLHLTVISTTDIAISSAVLRSPAGRVNVALFTMQHHESSHFSSNVSMATTRPEISASPISTYFYRSNTRAHPEFGTDILNSLVSIQDNRNRRDTRIPATRVSLSPAI
jgi:hypothetical protein